MVNKILGGYSIELDHEKSKTIWRVTKEGKDTKFSYKFYEQHSSDLDYYDNITEFIKEEQNRDEQERVSINLRNEKTNTTENEKLAKASFLLLGKVNGAIDLQVFKDIIKTAREKATAYDKELLDLKAEWDKLDRIERELRDIFGKDSGNVKQINEKLDEIVSKIKSRQAFLTENI